MPFRNQAYCGGNANETNLIKLDNDALFFLN